MLVKRLIGCCLVSVLFVVLGSNLGVTAEVVVTPEEMQLIRQAQDARADTIAKVEGAVVAIFGASPKEGGGSGVLFDTSGFALTNHHVIAAAGVKGKAGLSDGKLYDWKLVGTDPAGDLAVIQLLGRDTWPIAPLGDSDLVRTGDWSMAMGNPFTLAADYSPTVTLGIVSGVQRYQGGGMVYGNCIQVDSAINPGNSGGPLMNMAGEVIGINGRAAFAERGRVNVGVGFAISMKQIKNFIPLLMASKVAQHGTLDAQFGMRKGRLVCEAINLDSRAARAGLQLGDRLVSLNGEEIQTANQLANLMSMMPSDWPVRIVYEHDGREFDFAIRLSPLVSVARQAAVEMPEREQQPNDEEPRDEEPRDEEPRDEDAPDEEEDLEEDKPEGEEPAEEGKKKRPRRRRGKLPRLVPGAILFDDANQANALRLIERWQQLLGDSEEAVMIEWNDEERAAGDAEPLTASCLLANDGQFMLDDGKVVSLRTADGYYQKSGEDLVERTLDQILANPQVLSLAMQAARFDPRFIEIFGKPVLDGGDFVNGQPVYRVRMAEKTNLPLYLWLSMDDAPELVKAGFDKNGTLTKNVVTFGHYQERNNLNIAVERCLVSGVRSTARKTWTAGEVKDDVEEEVTPSANPFELAKRVAEPRIAKVYGAKVGRTAGYVTGIVVGATGQILTANGTHLNGDRIRVVLSDGTSYLARAEKRSRKQQLAMLKVNAPTPDFFDLSKPTTGYKGQWVLSFSNLFKIADGVDPPSAMLGIVSLRTRLEAKRGNQPFPYEGDVLLLDTISSNPGAPGGALVDAQSGDLMGMIGPNLESRSSGTKLNYAIPIDVLREFVEDAGVIETEVEQVSEARPYLGIRLFRVGGKRSPAYVDRVVRGSPAARAKLRSDDVILGIGDERIKTIAQYDEVFAKLKPGVEVELAVKRGQKLMSIVVVPEASKQ